MKFKGTRTEVIAAVNAFEKARGAQVFRRGTVFRARLSDAWEKCELPSGFLDIEKFSGLDGFKASVGVTMERTDEMLHAVNQEVAESKRTLESLHNEVQAVSDVVFPQLLDLVKRIRDSRMTAVREVRDIMGELKEIRKFFFDSDYAQEMERMERFVRLCKDIKDLKESGMMDAVADTMIKLAVKEAK